MADDGFDYDPNIIAHQRKEAAPLSPEEIVERAKGIQTSIFNLDPKTYKVTVGLFDLTGSDPQEPRGVTDPFLAIDDHRKKGTRAEIAESAAKIEPLGSQLPTSPLEYGKLKPSQLGQLSEIVQAVTLAFAQATLQEE